jgi:hypothetical protein
MNNEQPKIEITIDQSGQVLVTGPLENKILCLGMLKMAENAIINFKPSPIVPASGADVIRMNGQH